jgi:hypothetical protein
VSGGATTQIARHVGHQRYRLPERSFLSTSTGEQRHSRHGSATNSGLFVRMFPLVERATCRAGRKQPSRSRSHTVRWRERAAPGGYQRARSHRGHQEHLGCHGGHAQTLATMNTLEHEGVRNG